MLEGLAGRVLWDKRLSPRAREVWGLLIVLSPLALGAAVWMQARMLAETPVRVMIDRAQAVQMARQFAEGRGYDTHAWQDRVEVRTDFPNYRYLARQGKWGRRAMDEFGVWSSIHVRLQEPDGPQRIALDLTPAGRMLGYRITTGEMGEQGEVKEQQALAIAEPILGEMLRSHSGVRASSPRMSESSEGGSAPTLTVTWTLAFEGMPGLKGEAQVGLRGKQAVQERLAVDLTEEAADSADSGAMNKLGKGLYLFYACVVFVFVLIRYVKRRIQREASRQRMFLVAGLIASFFLATFLLLDLNALNVNWSSESPLPTWIPIVFLSLFGSLIGLAGGITYAGAEADLRETYPQLLTSLDALLSGKLFSRNVGRSVLLGMAALAWALLIRNIVYLAAKPEFPGLDSLEGSYSYLFSRLPWLSLLAASLSTAVYLALASVLAPLTVIRRYVKDQFRTLVYLTPLTWFALASAGNESLRFPFGSLASLELAAGVLVVFFQVDLLASLVLGTGFSFLVYFLGLSQVAIPWQNQDHWAMAAAAGVVAAGSLGAFFGRVERERDVRPVYAKEIEERVALEQELEAAKEAQGRLLPAGAPAMPGLSLAASCNAAEEVSGDFYDFYPIGKDRLGIFISDGGGNGLATALSIALTKGYLMHKVEAGLTPMETLRGLRAALGRALDGVNADGLLYAVVDLRERTLRYARLGETPSLLITGDGEGPNEILHQQDGIRMWEGNTVLSAKARVILYTNGVSHLVGEADRRSTNRWILKRVSALVDLSAEQLHAWLLKTIFTRRARLGARKANDDVTIVVVGLDETGAAEAERVA
ncbi:MAG: SpoIIE family protein phosphatase [Bryobacterales bacterium]|nr:SpoIIE family protein phosphatase [Bryobacterales bacterium]